MDELDFKRVGPYDAPLKLLSDDLKELETLRAQVAELKAENERLRMALADTEALEIGTAERCKRWRESHMMSQTKVFELKRQIAAYKADAERYRQLRRGQHWSVIDGIGNTLRSEILDQAIDAALAATKGES